MASIIKLLRPPQDEVHRETVTFTIALDPENANENATIEVPVFEMGDVEEWLEWRKLFERLLTVKNKANMSGPLLFRHARLLLAGEALDQFNACCLENGEEEETPEAFDAALHKFTNSQLPPHTAKRVKRYLLEIQKPPFMSVSQFVTRLQRINSYFPFMPEAGGQNTMLAASDLKFVLEQAVPQAWRSALERSGQHESMLFSEVMDYFKTLESLEEGTNVRSSQK
mgnify:CR=1 FL=1